MTITDNRPHPFNEDIDQGVCQLSAPNSATDIERAALRSIKRDEGAALWRSLASADHPKIKQQTY
ncbi:MAG: hypothetical protein P8J79_06025 [Halioglobus sp.]|nr:hypothetical protein [Halioglobus sp.]